MRTVDLGELEPAAAGAWNGLFDVAALMPEGWAVAGGQMVYLHCQENGVAPERPSDDGDVVLDVRSRPRALREFVDALMAVGFVPAGTSWLGHQHRWIRGDAQIDVLVPRHLGSFAERRDKALHLSTIAAPGAQHLLNRSEVVDVTLNGRRSPVRRPDVMGAIAAKAAAYRDITNDPAKDRHLVDILVLAEFLSARQLRGKDPWSPLERRRVANALGAIKTNVSTQARFTDVENRIARLAESLRYFD